MFLGKKNTKTLDETLILHTKRMWETIRTVSASASLSVHATGRRERGKKGERRLYHHSWPNGAKHREAKTELCLGEKKKKPFTVFFWQWSRQCARCVSELQQWRSLRIDLLPLAFCFWHGVSYWKGSWWKTKCVVAFIFVCVFKIMAVRFYFSLTLKTPYTFPFALKSKPKNNNNTVFSVRRGHL